MNYCKAKVYCDGLHYIAIPYAKQEWKKRKNARSYNEINAKVESVYKQSNKHSRKEKIKETIE